MFAWEPFAENDNSSSFRHHAVWAIAAPFVFRFPQRTCQHNECPTDHLSLTPLSSGDFFGWQWRAHARNGGKYAILGKYEGRGQVGCHLAGFPKEITQGVLEMPGAPQNPKWVVNHQTSPGTAGIVKNHWKLDVSHRFPLWSTKVFGKEMKGQNCTELWREAHLEVKMYKNISCPDHFWKLRCRKSARRCGAKHISKSKCRKCTSFEAPFRSLDVEKVHAVVVRSTFRSQTAENAPASKHLFEV